jgi:hypothetical protein
MKSAAGALANDNERIECDQESEGASHATWRSS